MRIGPNSLSVNTATALKTIYGFRSNVIKGDFYEAFPATPASVSVHSAIDKQQHARKRRVISHAFSDQAIKSLEKYVLANVRTGCRLLAEKSGQNGEKTGQDGEWADMWNVADWCNWLVFDIMGDLVFGKAFGVLESPANRFAIEMVGNAAHRHLIVSPFHPDPTHRELRANNIHSAEPISQSTTGVLTKSSSERSQPKEANT